MLWSGVVSWATGRLLLPGVTLTVEVTLIDECVRHFSLLGGLKPYVLIKTNILAKKSIRNESMPMGLTLFVRKRWNFSSFARNFPAISTLHTKRVSLCANLLCQLFHCWCSAKMWIESNAVARGELLSANARCRDGSLCVVKRQAPQVPDWFCQRYMLS